MALAHSVGSNFNPMLVSHTDHASAFTLDTLLFLLVGRLMIDRQLVGVERLIWNDGAFLPHRV
jgi:hypothetical protein